MFLVKTADQRPGNALGDLYARELYRALLDQHFDLKTYLQLRQGRRSLNNDELLARRTVVDGEALYAALLWRLKQQTGRIPDHIPLERLADHAIDPQKVLGLLDDPRMAEATGKRASPRGDSDGVPTYISKLMDGTDRNGLLFAHAIQRRGWSEVEKLYTTSPPVSTEQILHPEKWLARERPVVIEWPAFETNVAFADWELVERNVLGELMWRVVFAAHRLSPLMSSAPAGWNGDRYAVFKRRSSSDTLLLVYTAWDTEADAAAFAQTYRVLVQAKHANEPQPVRIFEEGRRVVIVEGGQESALDACMTFAKAAQETQEVVAVER
jgi:hypothetical protein